MYYSFYYQMIAIETSVKYLFIFKLNYYYFGSIINSQKTMFIMFNFNLIPYISYNYIIHYNII